MEFVKRPLTIRAERVSTILHRAARDWSRLPLWVREAYERGDILFADAEVHVHTTEGDMVGGRSDWLVRGVKGELYPCKNDVFVASYDYVKCPNTDGGRQCFLPVDHDGITCDFRSADARLPFDTLDERFVESGR